MQSFESVAVTSKKMSVFPWACEVSRVRPLVAVTDLNCVFGFAVPVVKPTVLPGTKALSTVSAQAAAAQKNKLKEPGGGSFR